MLLLLLLLLQQMMMIPLSKVAREAPPLYRQVQRLICGNVVVLLLSGNARYVNFRVFIVVVVVVIADRV